MMSGQIPPSYNFALEDTTDKCYRDISNELLSKGWNRVSYKKRSKLERKRFPVRDLPHAIWTLNEKDVDFTDLDPGQVCNHFEGITSLTTKRGFCDLLQDIHWDSEDADEISPRCYNLGDPIHREEFIDDFRLNAAMNILKWYLLHTPQSGLICKQCTPQVGLAWSAGTAASSSSKYNTKKTFTMSVPVIPTALAETYSPSQIQQPLLNAVVACIWFLRVRMYGEWPEVDISRYFKDRETPLEEAQWCAMLDFSYALSELRCEHALGSIHSCFDVSAYGGQNIQRTGSSSSTSTGTKLAGRLSALDNGGGFDPFVFKLKTILYHMARIRTQSVQIDGYKNIWVIKAPDSSCGIGIKILSRLNDILQCEKGMGGRTVQKYVEFPFLAPVSATTSLTSGASGVLKFDTRIWVLVTSFEPLQAHIFSQLYGRRCGTAYSTDLATLTDSYAHLTNYSVQKKQKFSTTETERGGGEVGSEVDASQGGDMPLPNAARKLRGVVKSQRGSTAGVAGGSKTTSNCEGEAADAGGEAGAAVSRKANLAESDLLMSHEEIARLVQAQYAQYQASDSSLARSVVQRLGAVEDVWAGYIWPEIRRKVLATLQAASREVTQRACSFEFLGYDVIIDALLEPWILEVNMSPAMAHRTPEQSALIAGMCAGLLDLAVLPHFPNTAGAAVGGNDGAGGGDVSVVENRTGGRWEPLTTPAESTRTLAQAESTPVPAEAPPVELPPLNDWDEIPPPGGHQSKSHKDNSSLQRKFSGIVNARGSGAVPNIPSDRRAGAGTSAIPTNDAYFQKFINAAASAGSALVGGSNKTSKEPNRNVGNMIMTGTAVDVSRISWTDSLCSNFERFVLMQRWWHKKAQKLREYNLRRRDSAIKIQCCQRMSSARLLLAALRAVRAAEVVQRYLRGHRSRQYVRSVRQHRAAVAVQRVHRGRLGRVEFQNVRRAQKVQQIRAWAVYHIKRRHVRAAVRIVLLARKWLERRRRRVRMAVLAQKEMELCVRQKTTPLQRIFAWWSKETKARDVYRKCNRKIFSRCAAEKAQRKQKHRQDALDSVNERREEMQMHREEQRTLMHVAFLDSVDFVQEVVEDLLDDTWHVIRKLPSYRSGRRGPHSPRASPSATSISLSPRSPAVSDRRPEKKEGEKMTTPKKSRLSNAGSIEEFLSLEFSAARALRRPSAAPSAPTNSAAPPAAAPVFEPEDDFQFTADQELQRMISQTEVRFDRSSGRNAMLHHSGGADSPSATPAKRRRPQEQASDLFSSESKKLLEYMDAITLQDVTQPTLTSTAQAPVLSVAAPGRTQPARTRAHAAAPTQTDPPPAVQTASRQVSQQLQQDVPVYPSTTEAETATYSRVKPAAPVPEFTPTSPTSSPKVIINHRKPRVRPNVEYAGQFPVAAGDHNDVRSGSTSRVRFSDPVSQSTTAEDLDAAIQQASLLNLQNMTQRRSSNSSATRPVDPRLSMPLPTTAGYEPPQSHAQYEYVPALDLDGSEWEMEHTHMQVRRGGENVSYAMTAEAVLGRSDSQQFEEPQSSARPELVEPPEFLRRSFDQRNRPRGPRKQQHDEKNWYSYDYDSQAGHAGHAGSAGSAGSTGSAQRDNEMWFLFLKQKRDAQVSRAGEGQPPSRVRPHSSDGIRKSSRDGQTHREMPTRPMPHTAASATVSGQERGRQVSPRSPRTRAATAEPVPGSRGSLSPRRREWSFDEPSRHHVPHSRPLSAGDRSRAPSQPSSQYFHQGERPSLEAVLSQALRGFLDTPDGGWGAAGGTSTGASYAAHTQVPHAHTHTARSNEPPAPRATSATRPTAKAGGKTGGALRKKRHEQVKERLTTTYMNR